MNPGNAFSLGLPNTMTQPSLWMWIFLQHSSLELKAIAQKVIILRDNCVGCEYNCRAAVEVIGFGLAELEHVERGEQSFQWVLCVIPRQISRRYFQCTAVLCASLPSAHYKSKVE
jgi:hypothetical protein